MSLHSSPVSGGFDCSLASALLVTILANFSPILYTFEAATLQQTPVKRVSIKLW